MGISLYDVSVASFQQTLGAVAGILKKGESHCSEHGIDLQELVESRLHADMLPLRFQIQSVVHHSRGAIEGARAGKFMPPSGPDHDYAGLQQLVADACSELDAVGREDVDSLEGRDVIFQIGDFRLDFLAEDFLMTFSLPNMHFHATTAYDILRMRGVPLGKRDYLGRMRIKR
ncbi:DUF1993 domain-containing protein [Chromatocurvus halotolerans]|uniref:DUF1993 domain-containing protein n=1 Tax=Chromatocurvus halotolerans TaxID=1132028 RepID=A0A4R2KX03_9GAMM|nr:DUF1993 domain-containing protein [Chromatocurvus halotolerans]TCO78524.1 hypothetical protein EV688_101341 [Chromatocurvus halotolerans]